MMETRMLKARAPNAATTTIRPYSRGLLVCSIGIRDISFKYGFARTSGEHFPGCCDNRPDVFEGLDLGDLEFHSEFDFNRSNESHVAEGVPACHVFPFG